MISREKDGPEVGIPMKNLINSIQNSAIPETLSRNTPSIILEYEKHQNGIADRKKLEMDEPCKYKQGFLSMIIEERQYNKLENTPETLILRPVFGVLNKHTLSLFENEHLSGLYATLRLSQVKTVFQPFKWNTSHIYCFRVKREKPQSPDSKPVKDSPDQFFQLCAENALSMDSWITAIKKYATCSLAVKEDDSQVIVSDDPEIVKIRLNREENENKKIQKLKDQDDAYEELSRKESENDRLALEKMKEKLNKMKSSMYEEQEKAEKERLRAIEERRRQIELQAFLHEKEDCLQSSVEMGAAISTENSESKIVEESDSKISDLMSGTSDSLQKESEKDRILMQHNRIEQLQAEKELNEHLQNMMVQTTVGFEQLLDTADCYADDLAYNTKGYITDICAKMFSHDRPPNLKVQSEIKKENIRLHASRTILYILLQLLYWRCTS